MQTFYQVKFTVKWKFCEVFVYEIFLSLKRCQNVIHLWYDLVVKVTCGILYGPHFISSVSVMSYENVSLNI